MKQLSQEEKEKISMRLYWDMKVEPSELFNLLNKETGNIKDLDEMKLYRRLLISCDWYTILKLISLDKLSKILSDQMIESLFPADLKKRYLYARKVLLKNDVSYHYGDFINSPIFKKIDNWRNILSNKLCALTRMEPKDIADIIFISGKYSFEWEDVIEEAKEKDLWIDPLEICKILSDFPSKLLLDIKWIDEVDIDEMENRLKTIHDDIFYGRSNSLK